MPKLTATDEIFRSIFGDALGKSKYTFGFDKEQFVLSMQQTLNIEEDVAGNLLTKLEQFERDKLKSQKDLLYIKMVQLLNVSNRIFMIEELRRNDKNIKCGIWGLLFYLSLTCFDSLGQNNSFKTFYEWLISKKNNDFKFLESKVKSGSKINLKKEIINLFEIYNADYGVKNAFYSFLDSICTSQEYEKLIVAIKVPMIHKVELDKKGLTESFKRDWLFSFRNDFTHKSLNRRHEDSDDYTLMLGFIYCGQSQHVSVLSKSLLNSAIECAKYGLNVKFNELYNDI